MLTISTLPVRDWEVLFSGVAFRHKYRVRDSLRDDCSGLRSITWLCGLCGMSRRPFYCHGHFWKL